MRHSCDYPGCTKNYGKKYTLTRHKKIHLNTAHSCSGCGKKFCDDSGLSRHIRVHTGEKPYPCLHTRTCGKAFVALGNLKIHMNAIHDEKYNTKQLAELLSSIDRSESQPPQALRSLDTPVTSTSLSSGPQTEDRLNLMAEIVLSENNSYTAPSPFADELKNDIDSLMVLERVTPSSFQPMRNRYKPIKAHKPYFRKDLWSHTGKKHAIAEAGLNMLAYDNQTIKSLLQPLAELALKQNPPVFLCVQPESKSNKMEDLQRVTLKAMKFLSETVQGTPALVCAICRAFGAVSGSHLIVNMVIDNTLIIIDPLMNKSGFQEGILSQILKAYQEAGLAGFMAASALIPEGKMKENSSGVLSVAIAKKLTQLGYAKIKNWLEKAADMKDLLCETTSTQPDYLAKLIQGQGSENHDECMTAIESEHSDRKFNLPPSLAQNLFERRVLAMHSESQNKKIIAEFQTAVRMASTDPRPSLSESEGQLFFRQHGSSSSSGNTANDSSSTISLTDS